MRFKVSLAQINPKSGDISANARKILRRIEHAKKEGCDLVVFPEMCLTGYCLDEKLLLNRHFLRANKNCLIKKILPATDGIAVVMGFIDFDEERTGPDQMILRHNSAAVLQNCCLLQIVHKRLLPAYRYFDDKRYFTPGKKVDPIDIKTTEGRIRIGVLICEDLWDEGYSLNPCRLYREKGAEYLFTINASPFVGSRLGRRDGKRFIREKLIRQQVKQYGLPIIYVNTVGIGDNGKNVIPFDGFSLAYDRRGERVVSLCAFEEDQKTVCFENGCADSVPDPEFNREAEIYQALVMGVQDYYRKVGIFQGVLESVSGGIDSSLGTAIAHDAMGSELLSIYNLPSRYNSAKTQKLARQLAENFKLSYTVIPIQEMVDQMVQSFERYLHPIKEPTTLENLQARIRGLIMMAESNDRKALLLTNGNETEIALGYTTLYGDMAGGLSVIGDLSKPEIYRLSKHVNQKYGRPMIPNEIFEMPATAELKQDQVDPFDYTVVGPVVSDFVERGLSPEDLVKSFEEGNLKGEEYEQEEKLYENYSLEKFHELVAGLFSKVNTSVYKRLQGAPIIVVSERAFGFDLRETIINGWKG